MSGLNITRTGGLPSFQALTGDVHNTAKGCKGLVSVFFSVHGQLLLRPPPKGHIREQTKACTIVHFKIWYPDFLLAALVSNPSCIPSQEQRILF